MAKKSTYTATGSSYTNNGDWANSKQKNPVYIGTNSSGSYKYIGQFIFPSIKCDGEITKITLSLYRTSDSATYSRTQYYGCSESQTDYGSVLSTGKTVEITGGAGWKTVDVSGIIDTVKDYSGAWALLIGNPNNKSTYCAVSGYGSGNMPYLTVTYDDGSKVYYAATASEKKACTVYYASLPDYLCDCNVYIATSTSTLQKI